MPVNEIGMYDGDRSRKHGLLRACERDKQARQHAVSSAATLSTKTVDLHAAGCNPACPGCDPMSPGRRQRAMPATHHADDQQHASGRYARDLQELPRGRPQGAPSLPRSPMSFAPTPARHGTAAVSATAVTGPTAHEPPTPRPPGRSRASCRHLSSQTSLPRLPSTFTKSTRRARVRSRTASGVLA